MTESVLDMSYSYPVRQLRGGQARSSVYRAVKSLLVAVTLLLVSISLLGLPWSQQQTVQAPLQQLILPVGTDASQPWSAVNATRHVTLDVMTGDTTMPASETKWVTSVIQQDAWPIVQALFASASIARVHIILYNTEQGYEGAVRQQFSGNALDIARRTGGFTVGTTVYVPIYKYSTASSLADTVAHELTHVFLNVSGISRHLPQWLNEGFAWTIGLKAAKTVDPSSVAPLLAQLSVQLDTARKSGHLAPLTTRTAVGLQKNFEYNLEFEDYLAVSQLEKTYGVSAMTEFLKKSLNLGVAQSFKQVFGQSVGRYEQTFYGHLSAN